MSSCSEGFNALPGAFGIDVGVRRDVLTCALECKQLHGRVRTDPQSGGGVWRFPQQSSNSPSRYAGQLGDSVDAQSVFAQQQQVYTRRLGVDVRFPTAESLGRRPMLFGSSVRCSAESATASVGDVRSAGAVNVREADMAAVTPRLIAAGHGCAVRSLVAVIL